ncbi:hypothetical protein DM02DRAFT_515218 [Periconia macrospinosa]|uniref:Uncharacterized protein n=1 Tax=Periconia macrospinosa TaxID=97972 RepID=A0A2V1EA22_9PLEO|nr:hypothetical protein DM02DRAFT_515218 [Periconia macrospinosa]
MWKRLQGHGREKERQIGHPVLVETTYDQDRLRHIPNVGVAHNASYQSDAFSPSDIHDLTAQYPQHSQYPQDNRASGVPTVSSVYSQPSPGFGYDYNAATNMRYSVDISPPSSPELRAQQSNADGPRRFRSMRDVSPVDEERGRTNPSPQGGSNIPVLRKAAPDVRGEERQSTQKFWGGKVAPNSKVRWDEYSGEPTSSNVGKSGQVNPRTFSQTALSPPTEGRPMGNHVSVTGPEGIKKPIPLAERANRFGRRPSPVDTKPREPWSLASGRIEIVKPFKDQPSDKPLNFMRKADRVKKPDQDVSNSLATTTKHHPVGGDAATVADFPGDSDLHQGSMKPVVPLKVGRNSPNGVSSPISPQSSGTQVPYSYPSPITPTNRQSPVAPSHSDGAARREIAGSKPDTPPTESGPKSRFSWTTYNSGTTYQHSPPPSPPPPLPTSVPSESTAAPTSLLNHKRPVPASDNKIPLRKPVAESTASIMQRQSISPDPPSPRPESTFSTNPHKALPRPPTELTAVDHIETLESQMEDLRIRRNNVYRLLNDLNNMAPPNPMITDFKRMRLVDQRKKDFENELAEIKVEEHDVGLKLHRAIRKRDKNDPNGGSALWVRRVAS